MPHHADHATTYVPDSLDNSIIGNRPGHEWQGNLHGSEIMKAIHLYAPAIDHNTLLRSHMAVNRLQPCTKAMLNHLHSSANTQDR